MAKSQIFRVQLGTEAPRLIEGKMPEVRAYLIAEYSIEPCTVAQARELADTDIEDASKP